MNANMASFRSPSNGFFPHATSPIHPPHSASSSHNSESTTSSHSYTASARSMSGGPTQQSRPLPTQPYPHPESPDFASAGPSLPTLASASSSSLTSTRNALPRPPAPSHFARPPHLHALPDSNRSSAASIPTQQSHQLEPSFRNLSVSSNGGQSPSRSPQPSDDGHGAIGAAGSGSGWGTNGRDDPDRPSGENGRNGPSNPLEDLIESEGRYVGELGLIIKTVAGAWSRENLPPPALDGMFRAIEGIWKINRGFHARLQQIGTKPSSPKVLGDLLMKWIDDMAPTYFKYSSLFYPNFSSLSSVRDNKRLPEILANLPPPPAEVAITSSPISPNPTGWTLDGFFSLPRRRVRYYRKLYAKLLRSTKEGRSDHRLLTSAVERLEVLEREIGLRLELDLNGGHPVPASKNADSQPRRDHEGRTFAVVNKETTQRRLRDEPPGERISTASTILSESEDPHGRIQGYSHETPRSSTATSLGDPSSPPQVPPKKSDLIQTVLARGPEAQVSPPIDSRTINPAERYNAPPLTDLEIRLDTERTLDLFSMQPKPCKLQMRPPGLSFTRKLRTSADATLYFTPTSTRREVSHQRAHIFVLTDLFLMCELMTVSDKVAKAQAILKRDPTRAGDGGPLPEMWLLYPPLAGRHLSVLTGGRENELIVEVMKKERFLIRVENREAREDLMQQLQDCILFASSVSKPGQPHVRGSTEPTSPRIDIRSESPLMSRPGSTDTSHSGGQTLSFPTNMMAPPPRGASLRSPTLSSTSHPSLGDGRTVSPKSTPPADWQPSQLPQRTMSRPRHTSQTSPSASHAQHITPQNPSLNVGLPHPGQIVHVQPGQSMPMRPGMIMPGQLQAGGYGAPLPRNNVRLGSYQQQQHGGGVPNPGQSGPGHMSKQGQQLRKAPSHAQIGRNQHFDRHQASPMPHSHSAPARSRSAEQLHARDLPPNAPYLGNGNGVHHSSRPPAMRRIPSEDVDHSPPASPIDEEAPRMTGQAVISAQMKCKVFLKQGHQQWKSLGSGRLKLYVQTGANLKQLCVEADSRDATMLISTIVLTDGVERVGKTGVAIDISDTRGGRTGVVYMLQMRNEESARGLFDGLLAGSDRAR